MRTLALALSLVLPSVAFAKDSKSLANYLPEDIPVYVEVRNPPLAELKEMTLYRILQDPGMKKLLETPESEGASMSNMRLELGHGRGLMVHSSVLASPSVAVSLKYIDEKGEQQVRIHNRLAFAWAGITSDPFPLDFIAALEVDDDPAAAVAVIERIAGALSLHARGDQETDVDQELGHLVSRSEHAGTAISTVTLGPVAVHMAPVGALVVVATSADRLRQVIDRNGEQRKTSLADSPRYKRMLAEAPGTGTASTRIIVNADHMVKALAAAEPENAQKIQSALQYVGLQDLEGITTVARTDGSGVTATTSVNFTGPDRRGLARLFGKGHAAEFGCLDFAPRETLYVNCGSFDTRGLYDMFAEVGGMGTAMVAARFEALFGLKLRQDLLDLLGPEAALIVAPNKGLIPDIALVSESPDAGRLEKNLLSILAQVPWPKGTGVTTYKLRDVTVHAVPLGHQALGGTPIAPTFALVDGHLVITLFPLTMQKILAVKRGDRPSLAQNRDFANLRARVPEGAQGLSYLDMPHVFEFLYDTAVPLMQAMPNAAGASQFFEFPDVEVFSKYLIGRIAWRTADERGLKWQSHSALDTSGFLLSMVAGAGFALYYVARPEAEPGVQVSDTVREVRPLGVDGGPKRGDRESRLCQRRVRLLKARIEIFEHEKGRLPEKLDDLAAKWVKPETFFVPGTDGKRYEYLGADAQGAVLLHGYPNGNDRKICVVTTGMRMLRVSEEELNRLLKPGAKVGRGAR